MVRVPADLLKMPPPEAEPPVRVALPSPESPWSPALLGAPVPPLAAPAGALAQTLLCTSLHISQVLLKLAFASLSISADNSRIGHHPRHCSCALIIVDTAASAFRRRIGGLCLAELPGDDVDTL